MAIKLKILDALEDRNYRITIIDNKVNIINYQEIIGVFKEKIIVRHQNGYSTVNGRNLRIVKLLDEEILITGNINSIDLRGSYE